MFVDYFESKKLDWIFEKWLFLLRKSRFLSVLYREADATGKNQV
jgi:hypothetical protein